MSREYRSKSQNKYQNRLTWHNLPFLTENQIQKIGKIPDVFPGVMVQ
ncbi:hypothetical protein HMPREF3201_02001 [Megasphaera sp. MJR8396C]|nr:hypothetical protein HMPREF3201_02001 [Megasphaera sp. MJR8396C]